jgi:hypothetical protein
VGRVRVRLAAAIVVELAEKHHRMRGDAVFAIEPSSARSLRIGHAALFDAGTANIVSR